MGLASILLALAAFVCAGIGFATTLVPVVGAVFSFMAPAVALLGVILGGVAMSRAKQAGQSGNAPLAGVILSVVAFVPSLVVALFCGVCNAALSSGNMHVRRDVRIGVGGPNVPVAGAAGGSAGIGAGTAGTPGSAGTAGTADMAGSTAGSAGTPGATAPGRPTLPPPPLPAGPRRDAPKPGR